MKQLKLLLFTFFLFQGTLIFSQNWEWGKHVTGTGDIFNQLTKVDGSGNIIVAGAKNASTTFVGTTYTLDATANTPFLAKYNPDGSIAWLVNIGNKDATNLKGLNVDSQGNIIISGQFRSTTEACVFGSTNTTTTNPSIPLTSAGVQDAYLAKYDTNGNLLWAYDIGQGTGDDRGFGVVTDSNDNIYVGGYFVSSSFTILGAAAPLTKTVGNTTGGDGYIVKYTSAGSYLWHKHFSSPAYARNTGGIALAPSNGIYIAIDFTSSVSVVGTDPLVSVSAIGNKAVAIFKISDIGDVEWARVIRGSTAGSGTNIVQGAKFSSDSEGNLYAIGQGNTTLTFDNESGGNFLTLACNAYDGWVAKYNSTGSLLWANIVGGLGDEMLNASSYRDGVISVVGYYKAVTYLPSHTEKRDTLANAGGQDIFLINYNSNGQYLGSTRLGGSLDDEASSVSITADGNTVLGTSFKSATINVPGIGSFTNGGVNRDMLFVKHINIHFLPEETPISCSNGNNGKLKVTISGGGVAPYTYSFAKLGGSPIASGTYSAPVTFENLDAGTYYIDITDNLSRTIRKYYKINNPTPISISGSVVNVSGCYANQNGEINVTVTGGTTPYTYLWDSEDGYGYIPTVEDQSNVTAGNYTLTVIDANGCEERKTFTVTQPLQITFTGSASVNNTSSNPSTPNGSITPVINNGNAPVTYAWQGPNGFTSTNSSLTDIRGGSYVLTVTANGCIADTMFCILDQNQLNACISEFHNPKCKGGADGSATVTYTNSVGAITIAWSNGQTDVVTATSLSKGDYTVTITDDMGTPSDPADDATVTVPFTIGEPEYPLEVATTVNKSTCPNSNDGSIFLTVNGWSHPYAYAWSTTDGSGIINGQKDQSGLTAGAYTVIVSDVYGCEITKNLNLTSEYSSPSITLAATPSSVVTEGTAVTLTASGGSVYEFFIDDVSQGVPSAQDNIVINNPVNNTRIKAVGYNTAGCSGESNEITLTVNPPTYTVTFSVTNSSTGQPIENAQVTIGAGSPIVTNSSGEVTANLVNGTYSYTVAATSYYSSNGEFTVNGDVVSVPVSLTPIPPTYTVTFTVTNKTTSSPIENAQITIGSDSPILTNSSGVAAAQKANGTYSYTITATTYYDITGEFTVTDANVDVPIQLTSTGINDNSLVGLNVFPNPFNTEIKFTLTDKISRVEVSNILGQKVIDINTQGANSVSTQEIPNGIYLVKFTAKNGDTVIRKLLKDNK